MPRGPHRSHAARCRGLTLVSRMGMRYDAATGSADVSHLQPMSAAFRHVGYLQFLTNSRPGGAHDTCPPVVPTRPPRPARG
jgi:hypothetical protein